MALETIPVVLSHDNVQQYLSKLDERGESHFLQAESIVRGKPIKFGLWRDGAADGLTIELNPNGTWNASHVLVVGDR